MTLIWHSADRHYHKVGFDKLISILIQYLYTNHPLAEIGQAHGVSAPYVCKLAKKYHLTRRWNRRDYHSTAQGPAESPIRAWRAEA